MDSFPKELRELYRAEKLIPFIGAGVSMSVEWTEGGEKRRGPSWRQLVDQAAKELGFEDPDLLRVRGNDLQILEYFRLKNSGQIAKLSNWLLLNMRPPDEVLKSSPIHSELAQLDRCRTIYTTNFDDLIERAFKLHQRPHTVVVNESHMGGKSGVTEIIKFHGDLNHPDQMVLCESDYERRLKLSDPLDYRLRSDILGRAILFVGYSFRDPNVSYLFSLVNEQFKNLPGSPTGRRAYIVVADPSDFEMQLFGKRNIQIVPVRRATMTEDIASLIRAVRS